MLRCEILAPGSPALARYLARRQTAYPNLVLGDDREFAHLAAYDGERLVGGISYRRFARISDDRDLLRHWEIRDGRSAVRIARLWLESDAPATGIHFVFHDLRDRLGQDEYIYGVLSLPLAFARARSESVATGADGFVPRLPLAACEWDPEAEPSSEGRKLFPIYLRLGASVLAPASGNAEDRSVRLAFGIRCSEVRIRRTHRPRAEAGLPIAPPREDRAHA